MTKKTIKTTSIKEPSKKRLLLFKGISIVLVPLLILFLIEMGLRLFNYGHNLSLFVEFKENKDYLVLNPDASKRYFADENIATTGNTEPFKKKKDNNTIRIFILGESTTIGYPYFHNGSFHRWLQYRLTRIFPDKNFEIINLSLTAVNSYTVLGFAKEVVNYEPDAVLVYTGHNEYYGALGAGSTQTLGSNPAAIDLILKLRELRLSQLVINVYEGARNALGSSKISAGGSRMQLMVQKQEIAYHSDLYEKGVVQFSTNMDQLMDLFNQKHIPLFISNLVSNEKDLKPFISFKPDSNKSPGFKTNFGAGLKAFQGNDLISADNYLKKADQAYGSSADCKYYLGQIAWQQGNFAQAKKYFASAKDLDGLRFRAPEQFNEIITQLCKKYPDTHLVDTRTAFEANANHGIVGNDLTVDHVHPNMKGYSIMSDAFYSAIEKAHLISVPPAREITFNKLLKLMPENEIDSLSGMYRILNLKKHWPYNESHAEDSLKINTPAQTFAYNITFKHLEWNKAMNQLFDYYANNHELLKARNILENMSLEYPQEVDIYQKLAMLCSAINDNDGAIFYFTKTFNMAPSFENARFLFVNYLKMDRPAEAQPYIDYAIQNNSSDFNLSPIKDFTEQVVQLKKEYQKDTTKVPVAMQIANDYLKMGNNDGALKYAGKILKLDSKNKVAREIINKLNKAPVNASNQ
jgi:tetratricopeptide (TPR) repeat protein